jgi:DNA-binding NtrC family response regulator
VGSDTSVDVDVRLIAATNRNLEELMTKGQFREDLFYRLNVVTLTLPPLRDRAADLAELIFFFLSRAASKTRKQIRQIEPAALDALESYSWPGNIRELENVIERAVVLADSDIVTVDDLPEHLRPGRNTPPLVRRERMPKSGVPVRSVVRKLPGSTTPQAAPMGSPIDEEQMLREALSQAAGNKAVAARNLNLPRSTFFSKCRKYGIT